jgi:hypothetical protein
MISENCQMGFVYTVEHLRDGKVIDTETVHNLVPTVGMNHILDVIFRSATAYANWYIGLYESNYVPVAADTLVTLLANGTECTAYAETTREVFTSAAASGGVISNTASKAEFTMNATKTLYGGFLTSNSVKLSDTGMLVSAVKFASPKSVTAGDVLRVTAGLTLTSS